MIRARAAVALYTASNLMDSTMSMVGDRRSESSSVPARFEPPSSRRLKIGRWRPRRTAAMRSVATETIPTSAATPRATQIIEGRVGTPGPVMTDQYSHPPGGVINIHG